MLDELSALLTTDFGKGYSATNLRWFRQFYLEYPKLVQIHHAVSDESEPSTKGASAVIRHAVRDESKVASRNAGQAALEVRALGVQRAEPWQPGILSAVPDFVAATVAVNLLIETKKAMEMNADDVVAKARAAAEWCAHASDYSVQHGGKPWRYLLVPHDAVAVNKTLVALIQSHAVPQG